VPLFSFLVGGSKSWDQRRHHTTLLLQKIASSRQAPNTNSQQTTVLSLFWTNNQIPERVFCYSNVCLDFLLLFNPSCVTQGILTH
jgi:hypothetical protein